MKFRENALRIVGVTEIMRKDQTTVQVFKSLYNKPLNVITKDDLGNAEEIA